MFAFSCFSLISLLILTTDIFYSTDYIASFNQRLLNLFLELCVPFFELIRHDSVIEWRPQTGWTKDIVVFQISKNRKLLIIWIKTLQCINLVFCSTLPSVIDYQIPFPPQFPLQTISHFRHSLPLSFVIFAGVYL